MSWMDIFFKDSKSVDFNKAAEDYVDSINENGVVDNTLAMSHSVGESPLSWIKPTDQEAEDAVNEYVDKLPDAK